MPTMENKRSIFSSSINSYLMESFNWNTTAKILTTTLLPIRKELLPHNQISIFTWKISFKNLTKHLGKPRSTTKSHIPKSNGILWSRIVEINQIMNSEGKLSESRLNLLTSFKIMMIYWWVKKPESEKKKEDNSSWMKQPKTFKSPLKDRIMNKSNWNKTQK